MLNPEVEQGFKWHRPFLGQDAYSHVKSKDSEVILKESKLKGAIKKKKKKYLEAVCGYSF